MDLRFVVAGFMWREVAEGRLALNVVNIPPPQ